jgi:uncharacterized membrane protein
MEAITNKEQIVVTKDTMDSEKHEKNQNDSGKKQLSPKNIAQIVYFCQALSFFFGITAIAGVILNYLKRDEAKESWLESHFVWQIRTFWIGLMASFTGFVLLFVLIGFLILAVTLVWTIYRVIKGYLLLAAEKPIENPSVLI